MKSHDVEIENLCRSMMRLVFGLPMLLPSFSWLKLVVQMKFSFDSCVFEWMQWRFYNKPRIKWTCIVFYCDCINLGFFLSLERHSQMADANLLRISGKEVVVIQRWNRNIPKLNLLCLQFNPLIRFQNRFRYHTHRMWNTVLGQSGILSVVILWHGHPQFLGTFV